MTRPAVTVVSPCYNHARYVIESLDAIRAQDHPNIQHIIIDDGSTDGSADIIERWIAEYSYPCSFIRHNKNRGLCASLNDAIDLATGDFWYCAGTDDRLLPGAISRLADYLEKNSECMIVSGDFALMNADSHATEVDGQSRALAWCLRNVEGFNLARDYGSHEWMLRRNVIPAPLVRMEVFKRFGKFDETLKLEDWEMWLRVVPFSRPVFINEVVGFYRTHPENTSKDDRMMRENGMKTFLKHYDAGKQAHPEICDEFLRVHFNDTVINPKTFGNIRYFLKPKFWPVVISETFRWVARAWQVKRERTRET